MLDPHDDTDVLSGSTDGAQMESTSSPVIRLQQVRKVRKRKARVCLIDVPLN